MGIEQLIDENTTFIFFIQNKLNKLYACNNKMLDSFDYYSPDADEKDILNCQKLTTINETIYRLISVLEKK